MAVWSLDTPVAYWQSVCATSARALSGSSGSVLVTKMTKRGKRARARVWSGMVTFGFVARRTKVRMQLAAILAVWASS